MPDEKLLNANNDLVFQRLFGKQKNADITAHLLSLILGREIDETTINLDVNKRLLKSYKDSKTGRLDVRAKFKDGSDCNIELQVSPYADMAKRMLDYWASLYDAKLHRGNGVNTLKPTISILIAQYKLPETADIKKYHTQWNLREKEFSDIILTEDIEFHILEIPKIQKENLNVDELVQWLMFIANPEKVKEESFMKENKYLKKAREELEYLSKDPDFQRMVDDRARELRDIAHTNEIRYAEGKCEKAKEIAKNLKDLNMPISQISQVTGLSEEEIKNM